MNIVTNHVDKYAVFKAINQGLYDSLLAAIGEENESYILCMKPGCNDQAEAGYRKWLGLVTLSAIINNSVTLGELEIEDVLEANNFCTC